MTNPWMQEPQNRVRTLGETKTNDSDSERPAFQKSLGGEPLTLWWTQYVRLIRGNRRFIRIENFLSAFHL